MTRRRQMVSLNVFWIGNKESFRNALSVNLKIIKKYSISFRFMLYLNAMPRAQRQEKERRVNLAIVLKSQILLLCCNKLKKKFWIWLSLKENVASLRRPGTSTSWMSCMCLFLHSFFKNVSHELWGSFTYFLAHMHAVPKHLFNVTMHV